MTYLEGEFTTHGDDEDVVHDLKLCVVHHPIAGLLQHHGDGGQGGDADHYPVQVGHKAKQLVESLETHLATLVGVQGILIMKSESSKCSIFLLPFTLIRHFYIENVLPIIPRVTNILIIKAYFAKMMLRKLTQ